MVDFVAGGGCRGNDDGRRRVIIQNVEMRRLGLMFANECGIGLNFSNISMLARLQSTAAYVNMLHLL